jgi:methyl-accepting chemotaxis protein
MVSLFARNRLASLLHVQSTDPDVVRRGRLVNTLLAGMIALTSLFVPLQLLDNSIPEAAAISVALALMVVALAISRRGSPTLGAYLFVGTCGAIITLIMITRTTAASALQLAPYMFVIPIIAAGVTAGRRVAFAVAGGATGAVLAVETLLPHRLRFELRADGSMRALGLQPDDNTVAMIIVLFFLCAVVSYSLERIIVAALRETDLMATDLAQAASQIAQRNREQQLALAVRGQSATLAVTVQQQSTATTEQSHALQEISVTVEQLAATTAQIAGAARQVQQGVGRVLHAVEQGQESDGLTSRSIAHLDKQVTAMNEQMQMVEQHVAQISRIAEVLSEVADNIHLLALNATIEAAGAGSYGRRFAVVAREVQDLADRARLASAEVQGQVAGIQVVAARALATTQGGRRAAAEAVAQAGQTRATHDHIRSMADAANEQAEQIAQATDQQRMAANQMLITLHTVVGTIRELADGSHRVADAAQHLSTLAGELEGSADHPPAAPVRYAAPTPPGDQAHPLPVLTGAAWSAE